MVVLLCVMAHLSSNATPQDRRALMGYLVGVVPRADPASPLTHVRWREGQHMSRLIAGTQRHDPYVNFVRPCSVAQQLTEDCNLGTIN